MYQYPDPGDRLTIELIDSVSQGDYWGKSEEHVLRAACRTLQKRPGGRMLDVGCGMGRLFPVFAPFVSSIFALEPDEQRWREACKSAAAQRIPVQAVNADISCLRPEQCFDVVLVSHVLQHIPESAADSLLAAVARHTAPDACVIVTTTHTDAPADLLTVEYFQDGRRRCDLVGPDAFGQSFSRSGVLPVRLFAAGSAEALLARHGFVPFDVRYYHYTAGPKGHSAALDDAKNRAGDDAGARDVLFLLKKDGEAGRK